MVYFQDRADAGRRLGQRLAHLTGDPALLVLGIPRGGVVVAAEVAQLLRAPLDVIVAHKLGAPGNPEYAVGSIADPGQVWLDAEAIQQLGLSPAQVEHEIERQRLEVARRAALYCGDRLRSVPAGRTVLVVDDGVATGATALICLRAVRQQSPRSVYLAVPVGPPDVIEVLERECDGVVVLDSPEMFSAVGRFYREFGQVDDQQVIDLLRTA